jgi:hypothetical protein
LKLDWFLMNRGAKMLLLLAIGAMPIGSLGADDEPVRAPYIEPGDCWSYHAEGFVFRGRIDDYELCVTSVDRSKNLILAVATVKEDGREIDTAFALDWAAHADLTGRTSPQGYRVLKFPLRVGDAYVNEIEVRSSSTSSAIQYRMNVRITGWEDITVPAGKFRALKVEVKGIAEFTSGLLNQPLPVNETWWYAPEVRRHVKYIFESYRAQPPLRRAEELTGYRLNK